ncbi:MAG: hypothetical protein M1814_005838 [Vezdaea aestivalis]|nr:MAG: hypothetical protein M1814_005838 [Vezdaea aestivalis]
MKNRLHAIGLDLQQSNVSNQKADAKILSLSDEPDNLMQYRQLQSTASADDDGYEELAQQELSAIDLDEDAWSQDVQYMTDGSAEILEAFETSQPRLDNYDLDEIQFKIPQHVFQDASEAPEGSAEHYWNHTMYRGPDGQRPEVLYCDNRETTEQIAKTFLNETVIGLDLEWKYNAMRKHGPRSNVSLIQVASQSRIALFHIGVFVKGANEPTDLIPPSLRKLIESPSITKVGVAINGDCTRLRNHLRLNARGRFELSQLYKLVKYVPTKQFWLINKRLVRLALQSEEHLHLPMFKGSSVRLADWSKQLNSDQIMYAASDPYACLHIYDALQRKRLSLVPPPPCPSHTELGLPIRIFDTPVEICEFPNLSTSLKASFNVQDQEESSDDDDASSCSSSLSSSSEFETLNRHTSPLKAAEPSVKKGSSICGRGSDKPTFRRAVAVNATASRTSVTVIASRPRVSAKIPRVPPHQVVEAESWIAEYCDSLSRPPKASRASLRAYALWHRAGLPIEECARSLREPPLQTSTVATYILEVVRLDQLECDPNRLRDLSTFVPPRLLETRYIGIRRLLDKTGP